MTMILNIEHLIKNNVYLIKGPFHEKPVKYRCLGNYGGGKKVYMTLATSEETTETMIEKFKNDQLPDCQAIWDYMLTNNQFQITTA